MALRHPLGGEMDINITVEALHGETSRHVAHEGDLVVPGPVPPAVLVLAVVPLA